MNKLSPSNILYIKLGVAGSFEEESIKNGKIIIDYREVNHIDCLNEDWKKVESKMKGKGRGSAKNHVRQLKSFYKSDEKVLWVTFYGNRLWWCFSKKVVREKSIVINSEEVKIKYRKVLGKWSDCDIHGKPLLTNRLSGGLLATQGYRGTICSVKAGEYLVRKINGVDSLEINEANKSIVELKNNLVSLISSLWWDDFEVLIDLIFHGAGWRRVSVLGKTQKSIDLELINPLTQETAIVQVKSESNEREFIRYQEEFKSMKADKKFFIVNSRDNFKKSYKNGSVRLYFCEDVAKLVINIGLIDWVVKKAT